MRQKTAYELRISDWSSDVCPSDLSGPGAVLLRGFADSSDEVAFAAAPPQFGADAEKGRESDTLEKLPCVPIDTIGKAGIALGIARRRSEEHTSELQSLMRISYAVFCFQNKTHTTNRIHIHI